MVELLFFCYCAKVVCWLFPSLLASLPVTSQFAYRMLKVWNLFPVDFFFTFFPSRPFNRPDQTRPQIVSVILHETYSKDEIVKGTSCFATCGVDWWSHHLDPSQDYPLEKDGIFCTISDLFLWISSPFATIFSRREDQRGNSFSSHPVIIRIDPLIESRSWINIHIVPLSRTWAEKRGEKRAPFDISGGREYIISTAFVWQPRLRPRLPRVGDCCAISRNFRLADVGKRK